MARKTISVEVRLPLEEAYFLAQMGLTESKNLAPIIKRMMINSDVSYVWDLYCIQGTGRTIWRYKGNMTDCLQTIENYTIEQVYTGYLLTNRQNTEGYYLFDRFGSVVGRCISRSGKRVGKNLVRKDGETSTKEENR